MAVFQFSALSDGQAISFNPNADVLNFDQTSIAAADIRVTVVGSNLQVTQAFSQVLAGKDVTLLNVSPLQLSITNVTFADGSRLLFGDTTSSTLNDNAANTINGTAGRDLLAGLGGADTMNGGLGNDTYIVSTGDVLSDTGGIDTVESDVNWNLADGFENLTAIGTANVQLTGNNAANELIGNSGNNFFNPRGGDDRIIGFSGNDWVRLGGGGVPTYGNKQIDGGDGFDTVDFGGFGRSAIVVDLQLGRLTGGGEGGTGSVFLNSVEAVLGDGFNDRISGRFTADSLNGGGGNDTLDGRAGNDTLTGGLGADTFAFSTPPGTSNGNVERVTDFVSGTDRLSFDNASFGALGAPGNFTAGDGRFAAGAGLTTGQDANDRLIYNTSTGQLFYDDDGSGSGSSQLVASFTGNPAIAATDIQVVGASAPPPVQGTEGDDTLTGTAGNDVIDGRGGNDLISGLAGADSLIGGAGNDTLDGGAGTDTLDGGLGNDTYLVRQGQDVAFPNQNPGAELLKDAGGVDTVIVNDMGWQLEPGIENLILRGTSFETFGIGNDLNNVIRSEMPTQGDGINLDGAGGNDTLIGGPAPELFHFTGPAGGFGHDSVDGGGGGDALDFRGASTAITVDFRTGTLTSAGGSVAFTNIEAAYGSASHDFLIANDNGAVFRGFGGNDTLTGGAGNDFLQGDGPGDLDPSHPSSVGGNDVITGGAGDDIIGLGVGDDQADGGSGNDTFDVEGQFNYGNDTISGGDGIDQLQLEAFSSFVIDLGAGTLRGGGAQGTGTASLTGIENVSASAFGADVRIIGSSAANNLGAGGQNVTLNGAGGNDTLSGGADVPAHFIFDQTPGAANADLIIGFTPAQDTLELVASAMPALGASGRFAAANARFHAAAGATGGHDADDRVVYDTSTGNLFYDADGSGAGAAQLVATLEGRPALAATDILVVGGTATRGVLITGTAGSDTLDGADGNDTIDGLGGDDLLSGRLGTDLVRGGDGNDRLKDREDSGPAPDTLDGGLGNDIFDLLANPLRPHTTVIVDAGGLDTVWSNHDFVLPAGIENLTLFEGRSGTGNELANMMVAFGNVSQYTMDGAGGNDTLLGATNSIEHVRGGAGSDVFAFSGPPADPSQLALDSLEDFVSGIDTIQLDNTGFANLGAPGRFSATDERFFSASGARAAHDATDRVIYDPGIGVLFYDPDGTGAAPIQAVAFLQGANPALVASDIVVGNTAPGSTVQGTPGNDSLTGTAGNDSISGQAGNDTINALGGDDTLNGGAGIDTMNGGLGNDGYIVTAGDVLADAGGFDSVLSDINWTLVDGFENLTLIGTANVMATGNNGANTLIGNSGNNFFNPRGGDDTIQAGAGNDLIRLGGGGVPTYGTKVIDGGAGFDTLDFGGFARSAISVNLATGSLGGGGEAGQGTARLAGIEAVIADGFNDALVGSAGADSLNGGGGDDAVSGGAGNDTLEGGVGIDTLNGGAGLDSFVFHQAPPAGGVDFITDFTSGSDKLLFDNAAFTALGADGAFAAGDGRFLAGPGRSSGADASDRLIYDTTAGTLWYDADGSGQGGSQQIATLVGHPALAATDITVI